MRTVFIAVLAALFAAAARAQERPYMYMWAAPLGGSGPQMTDYASQMVRLQLGEAGLWKPQECAQEVVARAVAQVRTSRTTDASRICILLQNFGGMWSYRQGMCFINDNDRLGTPSSGWAGDPGEIRNFQPWMVAGRAEAKAWMESFLTWYKAYAAAAGLANPVRFHFDTEVTLSSTNNLNFTRALQAIAQDPRYFSVPVPGAGRTLKDLYEQVRGPYGWGATTPLVGPGGLLNPDKEPQDPENRALFIWYFEVCQAAVDAAMKECAYDIIKKSANFPFAKVSNYSDFIADGRLDTFGWYTGRDPDASRAGPVPTRVSTRGETIGFGEGSRYLWKDIADNELRPRSLYYTRRGVASGDFSSPVIYPAAEAHNGADIKNYYLKDWPPALRAEVYNRNGRRWVESILNTPAGHTPGKVVPWICPPNTPLVGYQTTAADFCQTLAMLRAKDNTEVILWWDPAITKAVWPALRELMTSVYAPNLATYQVLTGECGTGGVQQDRLKYTLRTPDPADQVLTCRSAPADPGFQEVSLKAVFDRLPAAFAGRRGALNLECSVLGENNADVRAIRGQVYVQGEGDTWDRVPMEDGESGFGFFAPLDDDRSCETRRSFSLPMRIRNNDEMEVKIVLRLPADGTKSFQVRFDLVQLVGADLRPVSTP